MANKEEVENLFDTIIFEKNDSKVIEENVIKENGEVVDFTKPVETISDIDKKPNKKKKNKKSNTKKDNKIIDFWNNLSKKDKIIYGCIAGVIVILIILLIIFASGGKDKKEPNKKAPDVVFDAENYQYKNGVLHIKNASGTEVGTYECKNKSEKKCYIAYLSNEDDFSQDIYVDQNGEKLSVRSSVINDSYALVVDNKKADDENIILYNLKKGEVIDEYKLAKSIKANPNVLILKDKNNKYGALDLSQEEEKTVINFVYNFVGAIDAEISSKYLVLKKNDNYYVSDYSENIQSASSKEYIVEYNEKFIVTKNADNLYSIYDYEGKKLNDDKALFIKLSGQYYAILLDNGLFVYDINGVKYNEKSIPLSSTNYNKKYVYDANNQLISEDVAFTITSDDENIKITKGNTTTSLSIKEAQANLNHEYISYLDGVLYFYSDTEKNILIGKYSCKNKNTPGEFNNCYLATANSKLTAILNERYVFVKDGSNSIYLLDLKLNKNKGPYAQLDSTQITLDKEGKKNINNSLVIVKNTKGKYGLLKVNETSVDTVLKSEYEQIETIKDYISVKKAGGAYVLYDKNANQISKDLPKKVVNYLGEYVIINSDKTYDVYKLDGSAVNTTGFKFVKLEENYFVGIKDNQLNIFEYSDPTTSKVNNVKIKNVDNNEYEKLYKIEKLASGYKVTITDGENDAVYEPTV